MVSSKTVFIVHAYKFFVYGYLIDFVFCLCGWANLCIYFNLFTLSVDTVVMLFSDSRWLVGTQVYPLLFSLLLFFPLVILSGSQMEEEPFNPDYVEVDRVLEVSYCEDKDTGEVK